MGGAFHTPDSLFLGDRAASGWTVRLALVLLVVPFALGVVDLIVRARRRGLPFKPALRALRARICLALLAGLLLWLGALTGVFPTGAALPLAPYANVLGEPSVVGLLLLAAAFAVVWLVVRRRLVATAQPTAEEWLAGLAVALAVVGAVAIAIALTKPYALVFVVPSLYAWLALPVEGRLWQRVVLFAIGLSGPFVAFVLLGHELGNSLPAAVLYTLGLATVGYLPLGTVLVVLLWLAAAVRWERSPWTLRPLRRRSRAASARACPTGAAACRQSRVRYRTTAPVGISPSPRGTWIKASADARPGRSCATPAHRSPSSRIPIVPVSTRRARTNSSRCGFRRERRCCDA